VIRVHWPDYDSPINRGSHCCKGAAVRDDVLSERRLRYPVKLVNGLLADPHAICDFGDNRATDRTMRADILPGRNRGARGRWRTGLRLAYAAERKIAERRQCAGSDTGTR
jgi:hypothetical protein